MIDEYERELNVKLLPIEWGNKTFICIDGLGDFKYVRAIAEKLGKRGVETAVLGSEQICFCARDIPDVISELCMDDSPESRHIQNVVFNLTHGFKMEVRNKVPNWPII